jgi:hypothetical protein
MYFKTPQEKDNILETAKSSDSTDNTLGNSLPR